MAFAVHITMKRFTGYNNCVVARPIAASDLVRAAGDGKTANPDSRCEICAGYGGWVEVCPNVVPGCTGCPEPGFAAKVQ